MVAKAQGFFFQILHLALGNVQILLVAGVLVQRDQTMSHRTGIDRPAGQAQLNIFIHAVLDQLQITFIFRNFVSLTDAVIRHSAGPIPGHIHAHGTVNNLINCCFDLHLIKNQVCHFRCSFYFMRFSSMLCCI